MNKKNTIAIVLFIFLILSAVFYTVYTVVGREMADSKNGTVSIDSGHLDNTNKTTVNNTTDDDKESDNKTNNNTTNKDNQNTTKKPGNTTKPNTNTTKPSTNTTVPSNPDNGNNTTVEDPKEPENPGDSGNTTVPSEPDVPVEPPKAIYSRFVMASQSSQWYNQAAVENINFVKISDTEYSIQGEYLLDRALYNIPVISLYIYAPDSRFTKDIYQKARIIIDGARYGSSYVYEDTNRVPYMLIPIQILQGYSSSVQITWGDGEVTNYTIKHEHTLKEINNVDDTENNPAPTENNDEATK